MEAIAAKLNGESDGDDSFFDLVFDSPHRAAGKKDSRFVESPRDVLSTENGSSNSKDSSPVTLLRSSSSPKFKVFLRFSFRKSSSSRCEKTLCAGDSSSKAAEIGEIMAGDNTLRSQLMKEASDCEASPTRTTSYGDAVPKYLKLIKPLYQKVWKRRKGEKAKPTPPSPAPVNFSPMSSFVRMGSFKISAKRLVKSRSASAAFGLPPSACRKDDSLLEKHDGIQSAVLYCKKSFNSSSEEISELFRTTQEKPGRHSCELPIRCSI